MSQIDLNNVYLLFENSNYNLSFTKDPNGSIVLEGVFAEFGVENNNERIYEENEYLPHLEYLNKYIEQKRLLGHLDHPTDDVAQISLKHASHIIESLKYDPQKRQLIGRVRLLDTPNGKIAKSLIEQGIPLSISSRAVGSVDPKTKKASIMRIFTYDLVANPGFENATLKRVNEDLGIDSEKIGIYELTESAKLSLIKYLNTIKEKKNENEININKKNQFVMNEELTNKITLLNESVNELKRSVNDISELKERIQKQELILKEMVNVLEELEDKSDEKDDKEIEKVKEELSNQKTVLREILDIVEELSDEKEKDKIKEGKDNDKEKSKEVVESLRKEIATQKMVLNQLIDYLKEAEEMEKIADGSKIDSDAKIKDNPRLPSEDYLQNLEDVLEKMALKINQIESVLKGFKPSFDMGFVKGDKVSMSYLGEMEDVLYQILNTMKNDISILKEENELLKSQNKDLIDFQEYLVSAIAKLSGNVTDVSSEKGTKKIKPYIGVVEEDEDADKEKTDKEIEEAMKKKVKKDKDVLSEDEDDDKEKSDKEIEEAMKKKLKKGKDVLSEEEDEDKEKEKMDESRIYNKIINKTDKLIALIEKKENEAINESKKYPFIGLLNEDTKLTFKSLDESKKQKVAELVQEAKVFTEEGIKTIIQNVLSEDNKEDVPTYLKFASKEHLKLYESLSDAEKNQIARLAKLYEGRLQTEYQVKSFWDSQIVSRFKKEQKKNEPSVLLESKKHDIDPIPDSVINLIKKL
jgi:hypothetical protein